MQKMGRVLFSTLISTNRKGLFASSVFHPIEMVYLQPLASTNGTIVF
jgi:hypothetical protein